jgi:hypothetical protein
VVFVLAALVAPARADMGYGFFGIIPQTEMAARDIGLLKEANPGSMRIGISWAQVQPSPGPCGPGAYHPSPGLAANHCDWGATDAVVLLAAQAGLRVLPYLFAPPGWTHSYRMHGRPDHAGVPPIYAQADRDAWQAFVAAAVRRYGPGGTLWDWYPGTDLPVTVVQIWNEPSSPRYFAPKPDTRKFAQVLALASEAIRRSGVDVKVGLPGVFNTPNAAEGGIAMPRYYEQLYRVPNIREHFDYAAIHPYARTLSEVRHQVETLRAIMDRHGDRGTKIIVSELGWASNGPRGHVITSTPRGQVSLMRRSFRLMRRHRAAWGIFGVNWYSWRDVPAREAICQECPWTGLLGVDYSKKASFRAFKRFTR